LAVRIGLFVGVITHAAARHAHRIPHPTLVTTAKRPSDRGGTETYNHDFCKKEIAIFRAIEHFFCKSASQSTAAFATGRRVGKQPPERRSRAHRPSAKTRQDGGHSARDSHASGGQSPARLCPPWVLKVSGATPTSAARSENRSGSRRRRASASVRGGCLSRHRRRHRARRCSAGSPCRHGGLRICRMRTPCS